MRKLPFPVLAGLVLVVVLAVLHFAGVLKAKNPVLARVDEDVIAVDKSFQTIDLDQAMKVVTFDPPKMLNPPDVIPPLLKYVPSAETLAQMTGS
jgi:hypothetical protein